MSPPEVMGLLDELEGRLAAEGEDLDPEWLAEWNLRFEQAVETAERSSGWEAVVGRAHALAQRTGLAAEGIASRMRDIQAELSGHAQGRRALKGYRATVE